MTSTIKVNNIQNQCGANIINENSNTITIGASGDTVALASGASQSGFGRSGSVDWQTGSIKTTTFTATSGEGYFVDTSSGAVTANLPAGTAGAIVAFSDYTRTFGNNNLTITPNGSNKIGGFAASAKLNTNGESATFVFVDATEGWINVQQTQTSQTGLTGFIMASGGTETESGNCKIHTFTGPGTFEVTALDTCTPANNVLSYLVVAGGGGGGNGDNAGGGGAGGFREDKSPVTPYTASPLDGAGSISATVSSFPIVVGGGGAGATGPGSTGAQGGDGNVSSFSTISSACGGGGGGARPAGSVDYGRPGGSGGGAGHQNTTNPGTGNQPPVSPPQGNNGGIGANASSPPAYGGGGGGGATAVGANGTPSSAGAGGAGASTEISGSSVARGGGGGGGGESVPQGGAGGTGGGGAGNSKPDSSGGDGTANTGGGGGSTGSGSPFTGGSGGSGIVIIRYKFQ